MLIFCYILHLAEVAAVHLYVVNKKMVSRLHSSGRTFDLSQKSIDNNRYCNLYVIVMIHDIM